MNKYLTYLIVIAVIGLGLWYIWDKPAPANLQLKLGGEAGKTFGFTCPQGHIEATFLDDHAVITLPGRTPLTMPHAISADGARYELNGVVFWNKGRGAFVTENGVTTYDNCVQDNT